jgi:signal transduction histidine kinase
VRKGFILPNQTTGTAGQGEVRIAEFMKNVFPQSLPWSVAMAFVIGPLILLGDVVWLYADLFASRAGHAADGGRHIAIASMVANGVALAILAAFYRLVAHYRSHGKEAGNAAPPGDVPQDADALLQIEQLSALARHLLHTTEKEKAALAHELHSEFGACFSVATMDMSVVAAKLGDAADPALVGRIEHATSTIGEMFALTRQIIASLHPNMLDVLGLSFSLPEYAKEFSQSTGLNVQADVCEQFDRIDPAQAIALFRIAQEALCNVAQHANARNAWLSLHPKGGRASLVIADDGCGIAPDALRKPQSHGLAGMRERTLMFGGSLTVQKGANGRGTEIEAQIPVQEKVVPPLS